MKEKKMVLHIDGLVLQGDLPANWTVQKHKTTEGAYVVVDGEGEPLFQLRSNGKWTKPPKATGQNGWRPENWEVMLAV